MDIWYDEIVGRRNTDRRGSKLGNFGPDDQVMVFYKDGSYELTSFELTNRYEANQVIGISKFYPEKPVNAVHMDGESKTVYVKRFNVETRTIGKRFNFISEAKGSKLYYASNTDETTVDVKYKDGRSHQNKIFELDELIDVKGWKAIGNKFPVQNVLEVKKVEKEEPSEAEDDTLEELKSSIKEEVEKEDNQLGLFNKGKKEE